MFFRTTTKDKTTLMRNEPETNSNNQQVKSSHLVEEFSPETSDYQTLLLEGETEDYLILNIGHQTSWYRLNYVDAIHELSNYDVARMKGWIEYLFVNLIINGFLLLFLLSSVVMIDFSASIGSIILDFILVLFMDAIVVIMVYFMSMMFVEDMTGLDGNRLYGNPPLIGSPGLFMNKHIRKIFKNNRNGIPKYEHLVTISKYEDTLHIPADQFAGYRVRRTGQGRHGKFTKGYGIFVVKTDETHISIVPNKGILPGDRERLYDALNFSLIALGRSVKNEGTVKHAFLRGIGAEDNNLVAMTDDFIRADRRKDDFLRQLHLDQIGRSTK